ncbi:MAG: DUF4347 domain-containing protein, partial [Pirellulaceae bacterium]
MRKRTHKPVRWPRLNNPWAGLRKLLDDSAPTPLATTCSPHMVELESRILYSAAPIGDLIQEPELAQIEVNEPFDVLATGDAASTWTEWFAPDNQISAADFVALDETNQTVPTEILFIDAGIDGFDELYQSLLDQSARTGQFAVHVLNGDTDGIHQITSVLVGQSELTAIHIVSHGSAGAVQLGNTWLNGQSLSAYAGEIAVWNNAVVGGADLLFYGCNLAATVEGQELLESVAALTDSDVAASEDLTGHQDLGGDWQLEFVVGSIETGFAVEMDIQNQWSSVLATITVTTTADSGAGSLRQAINDANSLVGADTIEFDIAGGGPHTISLTSALPDITDTLFVDGTSEPDFAGTPVIELDGSSAGSANGLYLAAGSDGSEIRGLVINQFSGVGSGYGIYVDSSNNHLIAGNYIGTDVTGMLNRANTSEGISVTFGSNVTIGGTSVADRNVIAGNQGHEVRINFGSNNTIIGNYLGVDASGTSALASMNSGVWLNAASNNTIGGSTAAEANVIGGNGLYGVQITSSSSSGNIVQGNYIGTDATGTIDLGNTYFGVLVSGSNNMIGGDADGEGNKIAWNDQHGVVSSGSGNGNSILGNEIWSNDLLGIDLGNDGVTANDTGDGDTGANSLQNYPVLVSAETSGSHISIFGTLNSTPNTTFRLEFFASTTADLSGHGEARRYLGFTTVTTDSSGNVKYVDTFNVTVALGEFITATATVDLGNGDYGDTSEFALSIASGVATNNPPNINDDTFAVNENASNGTPVGTVTASDPDAADTLSYTIVAGDPTGIFAIDASGNITVADGAQLDYESITSFMLTVEVTDDGVPGLSDTATITVNVNDLNEAPSISATPGSLSYNENDGPLALDPGITVTDEEGTLVGATISFAVGYVGTEDVLAFTNQLGITGSWNGVTGVLSLTGVASVSDYQDALRSVTYANTSEAPNTGNRILSIQVNDGTTLAATSRTVTVVSVNDFPLNAVPAGQSMPEDSTLVFSGSNGNQISVSDFDIGSGNITIRLTSTNGVATLSSTSGLTFTQGDGTADADMLFSGSMTNVNAALDGLTFASDPDFAGTALLQIVSNDAGGSGSGGPLEDTDVIVIDVAAANDAPVATIVGSAYGVNEDDSYRLLGGFSVSDVDAGSGDLEVTLTVTQGVIRLTNVTGLTFSAGANDSATMTFTGTLADLNAALGTVTYRPGANFSGTDTVTLLVDDLGNTGGSALTDSDSANIIVAGVNDAPINTVPGDQTTNQDTSLVFSASNSNLISVNDIDAGSGLLEVTLEAKNGFVTLGGLAGLSFSNGDGTNDSLMTFSGTLVDINTALDGLSFDPASGYSGIAGLAIT